MAESTIAAKGQTAVPADIRKASVAASSHGLGRRVAGTVTIG